MQIYAAGPIVGSGDQTWKDQLNKICVRIESEVNHNPDLKDAVPFMEVRVLDPSRYGIDDSEETAKEIVKKNMVDILDADVVVMFCGRPSAGATIETLLAKLFGKSVFLVVPSWVSLSVWLMELFPYRGTWADFDDWLRELIQ